jgi:hypothetical protein
MIMVDYLPQAKLGPDVMRFSDAETPSQEVMLIKAKNPMKITDFRF